MFGLDMFTLMFYFLIAETIGMIGFAFWYLVWRDKDKTFFLFFDSDKTCSLETKKVRDGFVKFKKKYFYVDKAIPLLFQRFMGFQNPLLFIKWNDFIPVDLIRKTINPHLQHNQDENFMQSYKDWTKKNPNELFDGELKIFDKTQKDDPKIQNYLLRKKLTPETLKDVIDSKIASNLLKPLGSLDMIMYICIGLAIGFLLCISLMAMNVLPKV